MAEMCLRNRGRFISSSKANQFVVSTHSNIVTKYLCSVEKSRLLHVSSVAAGSDLPAAKVSEVEATPEARQRVLRELGYSFTDFDLWDGWLILEESSAERLIRDYLIPWFAPKLSRVRTLAAGGIGQVEPTFEDFHQHIRFLNLEPAYRTNSWVRVDAGTQGAEIVGQLQRKYAGWANDRFATFTEEHFEKYYPQHFTTRAAEVLGLAHGKPKQNAKKALLEDVRAWLDEDHERGMEALGRSAAAVIADLRNIEAQLS